MAEKRPLETVDSLKYHKLPRLEAEAGPHVHRASLCKSSVLPNYPLDSLYGYKGSYFAYPLQCHEGPKSLAHWAPSEAYAHCTGSPTTQPLWTEKGLGTQGQMTGKEKSSNCVSQETLAAPERWASWAGYPEFSSQAWLHSYMAQQSPRASAHCPNLAVPKPVYQNHVYTAEAGYLPKALGTQAESTAKLSPSMEWSLPLLGAPDCTESPCYSPGGPRKATVAESSFSPGAKHSAVSPAGFVPYRKAYEKCQGGQGGSFLDGSFSAVSNTQKNMPEVNGESPSKHIWSKLPPPPISSLANPASMMHHERSSPGYPPPPYPLTAHEHMLLYHQKFSQAEKINSLFPLPACKGFGSAGREDPQGLPGSYFPPVPVSYYPSHLESYLYRASGPTSGIPPPGFLSSREHEHQQNSRVRGDMGKPPKLGWTAPEKASSCSPLPRNGDTLRDCLKGSQGKDRQANNGFPNQHPSPRPQTSQPFPSLHQSPLFLSGFGQMPDAGCVAGFPHPEKARLGDEKGFCPSRPPSLTSDTKKQQGNNRKTEAGACIVISDSPVTCHDSSSKGDLPTSVSEDSRTLLLRVPQSPAERAQNVTKRPESPSLSSSPPMPVINNVFSLAPYREYLEGTSDTVQIPLSKNCQSEEDSPKEGGGNVESHGSRQTDSIKPSEASPVRPTEGKGPSCSGMTEGSKWHPSSNSPDIMTKDSPVAQENVGVKSFPAVRAVCSWPTSRGGASKGTGEMEHEDHALDLSCKMEGLVEGLSLQKSPEGKTEAVENSKSKGEEVKEESANKHDILLETNWRTSELPLKSGSEGKSNFQSSAAFLFKKFKILKSHAASIGTAVQQKPSPSFQPASSSAFSPPLGPDQAGPRQDSPVIQQSPSQVVILQKILPAQRSPHPGATWTSSSPAQQSPHQGVTQQTNLPVPQRPQQESTQQNRSPAQQSLRQAGTDQRSSPVQQSTCQLVVTQQTNPPVPPSPHQVMTQQGSPSIQQGLRQVATQPEARFLQPKGLTAKPSDTSKILPPSTPASSPVLGETKILVPSSSESLGQQPSPGQYFTALHTSVCSTISGAVSASSLEQLEEWVKKAESQAEPKEKGVSLAKPKNGLKTSSSDFPKLSKGKQIWLAFKEVGTLFRKLLSQLDTFLLTRKCPFPHVVRAGAIFIPIHVVKEKLFANLSSASIDHVLQDHKVELRPTTLSEEKLLRDLELRSCTSRMLKLLALKQLPDIYPDLLTLHWHECVKQQLDDTAKETSNSDSNASGIGGLKRQDATVCLQDVSSGSLKWNTHGNSKQGRKCGLVPQDISTCFSSETGQRVDDETSQELTFPVLGKGAAMKDREWPAEEKGTIISGALEAKGLHCGAKKQHLPTCKLPGTLQVKVTNKVARKTISTSKVFQLRKSVVHIKFQNALRDIKEPSGLNPVGKKGGKPASQFLKSFERRRYGGVRASALPLRYPELVGKRIRHLYEEKDKTEAWYRGVVLRVHKHHKDPLKTVYEVKYDSEPEWQYYLEILQDYKKGWLKLDE
uniref:Uncharacterized protein C15orf39 homolog isoform X1 n=1 Tax=Pogona vitticeps TaxID=103695 RepID=A0A6J0VGI4_9SAUR